MDSVVVLSAASVPGFACPFESSLDHSTTRVAEEKKASSPTHSNNSSSDQGNRSSGASHSAHVGNISPPALYGGKFAPADGVHQPTGAIMASIRATIPSAVDALLSPEDPSVVESSVGSGSENGATTPPGSSSAYGKAPRRKGKGARGNDLNNHVVLKRAKHNAIEVRRRQRINERIQQLKQLCGCAKEDKATILAFSVERIQRLQGHVTELKQVKGRLEGELSATQAALNVVCPSPGFDYKSLYMNGGVCMSLAGVDGFFLDCNSQFMSLFQYDLGSLRQRTFFQTTPEEDLPTLYAAMMDLMSGQKNMVSFKKRCIQSTGAFINLELNVAVERDESTQEPKYFKCMILDTEPQKGQIDVYKHRQSCENTEYTLLAEGTASSTAVVKPEHGADPAEDADEYTPQGSGDMSASGSSDDGKNSASSAREAQN